MSMVVHIERVILSGLNPDERCRRMIKSAIERELERLLPTRSAMFGLLASGAAVSNHVARRAPGASRHAETLSGQIAYAVYDALNG